jgi:CHAD domain-containing protein
MVLLGDEAQVQARFGLFGDRANLDTRTVHDLRRTYHRLRNLLEHMMKMLGDVGHVESHFGPFGDSVNIDPFGDSGNVDSR